VSGSAGSSLFFLVIIAVPIILIMLQRRTLRRQQEATQQHLAPGVEVMTGGGLYGYVHAVRDDVVELETSPGVITRWDRRAIARVLIPEDEPVDSTDLPEDGVEDDPRNP
jgi:preprotein translocase subunit YajC